MKNRLVLPCCNLDMEVKFETKAATIRCPVCGQHWKIEKRRVEESQEPVLVIVPSDAKNRNLMQE